MNASSGKEWVPVVLKAPPDRLACAPPSTTSSNPGARRVGDL